MGPLLVATIYLAQAGTVTAGCLALSVFLGFLVSNVLLAAQVPDIGIDRASRKMTIASVWGESVLRESFLFSAICGALALVAGVAAFGLPPAALLGLAGTLLSLRAAESLKLGRDNDALAGALSALQAGGILAAIGLML